MTTDLLIALIHCLVPEGDINENVHWLNVKQSQNIVPYFPLILMDNL